MDGVIAKELANKLLLNYTSFQIIKCIWSVLNWRIIVSGMVFAQVILFFIAVVQSAGLPGLLRANVLVGVFHVSLVSHLLLSFREAPVDKASDDSKQSAQHHVLEIRTDVAVLSAIHLSVVRLRQVIERSRCS